MPNLVLAVKHPLEHESRVKLVVVGYQPTVGLSVTPGVGVAHDHVTNECPDFRLLGNLDSQSTVQQAFETIYAIYDMYENQQHLTHINEQLTT